MQISVRRVGSSEEDTFNTRADTLQISKGSGVAWMQFDGEVRISLRERAYIKEEAGTLWVYTSRGLGS